MFLRSAGLRLLSAATPLLLHAQDGPSSGAPVEYFYGMIGAQGLRFELTVEFPYMLTEFDMRAIERETQELLKSQGISLDPESKRFLHVLIKANCVSAEEAKPRTYAIAIDAALRELVMTSERKKNYQILVPVYEAPLQLGIHKDGEDLNHKIKSMIAAPINEFVRNYKLANHEAGKQS